MAERPLLATDRVALAIRRGHQTQDRRPIRPRHHWHVDDSNTGEPWPYYDPYVYAEPEPIPVPAPWQPGDLLYVREACRLNSWANGCEYSIEFRADGATKDLVVLDDAYDVDLMDRWVEKSCAWLDAHDQPRDQYGWYDFSAGNPLPWRPNILMPHCVARTWVRVSRVWVERVRDISEADARAEGVEPFDHIGADQRIACDPRNRTQGEHPHTLAFAVMWDELYADRGYGWNDNPWVWCCEFEREEQGR